MKTKTFIFIYEYAWEGNKQLDCKKTQVIVVIARSLPIAKAIIETDFGIVLRDGDLVATLENQNNEAAWVRNRKNG